jgi:transposase
MIDDIMAERDARSLDHATLEEMRRLAVKRILDGETQREVARSLEVHFQTVAKWMAWYRSDGEEALSSTPATGRHPTLSERQLERLRRIILGKNPQQLNFGPALWTLPLVSELIEQLFGVLLHKTTVSRILAGLGLTPQKPIRRAFGRDDLECLLWMEVDFPRIVREARKRQSTLLFEDEAGVHEDGPIGTTWGEKGETPVAEVTGTRRRTNVISVVSPRGRLWFRSYRGRLNAPQFIAFLKALLHDFRKPIDLILDRHPAHVAASVKRFVHQNRKRLRLHELPKYAPNLNPDEHVWSYLKGMFRRDPVHLNEDFAKAVTDSMRSIQRNRELVRSFFHHPEVSYVREALGW